jgi:DNA polymerase-3 subunit alpha
MHAAEQMQRDQEAGQVDMFGTLEPADTAKPMAMSEVAAWPELQRLEAEKDSLGLYLTGHPVKVHYKDIRHFTACSLGEVHLRVTRENANRRGVSMTLAALVTSLRRRTQRGHFIAIEDHTGRIDLFLSNEAFATYADLLEKDTIIVIDGDVTLDEFMGNYRINANHIMSLADAKARFATGINIAVTGPDNSLCNKLASVFTPYQGGLAPVFVHYRNQRARVTLELGYKWQLRPCEELVAALNELEEVKLAGFRYQ